MKYLPKKDEMPLRDIIPYIQPYISYKIDPTVIEGIISILGTGSHVYPQGGNSQINPGPVNPQYQTQYNPNPKRNINEPQPPNVNPYDSNINGPYGNNSNPYQSNYNVPNPNLNNPNGPYNPYGGNNNYGNTSNINPNQPFPPYNSQQFNPNNQNQFNPNHPNNPVNPNSGNIYPNIDDNNNNPNGSNIPKKPPYNPYQTNFNPYQTHVDPQP